MATYNEKMADILKVLNFFYNKQEVSEILEKATIADFLEFSAVEFFSEVVMFQDDFGYTLAEIYDDSINLLDDNSNEYVVYFDKKKHGDKFRQISLQDSEYYSEGRLSDELYEQMRDEL